jgi:hypothetical protein
MLIQSVCVSCAAAPDLGEAEDVFVEAVGGVLVAHGEADVEEARRDARSRTVARAPPLAMARCTERTRRHGHPGR